MTGIMAILTAASGLFGLNNNHINVEMSSCNQSKFWVEIITQRVKARANNGALKAKHI